MIFNQDAQKTGFRRLVPALLDDSHCESPGLLRGGMFNEGRGGSFGPRIPTASAGSVLRSAGSALAEAHEATLAMKSRYF